MSFHCVEIWFSVSDLSSTIISAKLHFALSSFLERNISAHINLTLVVILYFEVIPGVIYAGNGQKHASLFPLKMKHIGLGCNCFLNRSFQVASLSLFFFFFFFFFWLVSYACMTSSAIPLLWEEKVPVEL